jgi:hypothetical protein
MDENMDVSCFNMDVRMLAYHDIQIARDAPTHYMDLNCMLSIYTMLIYIHFTHDVFITMLYNAYVACHDIQLARDVPIHYMDLNCKLL